MKTRAIPGSGGKLRIRLVNASKPPAEAPTATIGNLPALRSPGAAPVWPLCGRERMTSFFMTVFGSFLRRPHYREDSRKFQPSPLWNWSPFPPGHLSFYNFLRAEVLSLLSGETLQQRALAN